MGRAWPCRLRSTCVIENKTGLEIRLRKPVTFRSDNETRTRKRGRGGSLIPRQRRREGGRKRKERRKEGKKEKERKKERKKNSIDTIHLKKRNDINVIIYINNIVVV